MNNFCLKIRFSQAQHAMSDFCFQRPVFFCEFFSNLFSSKLPSIFTRNETFCEHKELLKVFSTVRFTGDLQLKNFSKNDAIFLIFCFFFKLFSVEKDGFPVGEELFSRSMRIPSGVFGAVKLMKF